MSNKLANNPAKLEWTGRLCALLLNDATDVMRWFLMENLPRAENDQPNLAETLGKHRELFKTLRDQKFPHINHEMFDILFREDEQKPDDADLEISLLFVLIRFLCKIKPPSWKWWDVEPLSHQVTPIFDVIRLVQFKQRMREVVHSYEITEETFRKSLDYVTVLLDRLRSYRISSRRWYDDVIKSQSYDVTTHVKLVEVMRWQTMSLVERDKTYLNLKLSREQVVQKGQKEAETWSEFISHFGQCRAYKLSRLNRSKSPENQNRCTDDCVSVCGGSNMTPAFELHRCYQEDLSYAVTVCGKESKPANKPASETVNLHSDEVTILNRIDNRVFIESSKDSHDTKHWHQTITEDLRKLYINNHFQVAPLVSDSQYRIHMDDIIINLSSLIPASVQPPVIARDDVPLVRQSKMGLSSWREIMNRPKPLRVILSGDWSSGKTTVLRKIAYEWSTHNSPELSSYQFLFYIDMALIKSRQPYTSLSECIIEQCCKSTISEIEQLFDENKGSEILLLFDGAERMPDAESDVMCEISDVICGKRWPSCSIIVTTTCSDIDYGKNAVSSKQFYKNINYFVSKSNVTWGSFCVNGFTSYDVITHAKHYFASVTSKTENAVLLARKFLNFIRVFQRDVYKGIMTSPSMTYLLCSMWLSKPGLSSLQDELNVPETLSEVIKFHIDMFESFDDKSDFCEEVLNRTLNADSGNFYPVTLNASVCKMIKLGLVVQHVEASIVKFAHVLLEDYIAAKCFCSKFEDERDFVTLLRSNISSLGCVVRLRHFLVFCCSLNPDIGDEITGHISELMKQLGKERKQSDLNEIVLQESVKHITLQCLHELNAITHRSFLSQQTSKSDDPRYEKGGSDLFLRCMNALSHRSKQAFLFLTSRCRPALTQSATVFPFLNRANFWIRTLRLSQMNGSQMSLVASLLRNLPFLEEAAFDEIRNLADDDVTNLCRGLNSAKSRDTNSALHCLVCTQQAASPFDACKLTSYHELGEAVENLPYLENLEITIPSAKLLFSIFTPNGLAVIPLTRIDLSRTDFGREQCRVLAALLRRLIFVEELNLSKNPVADGFAFICDELGCVLNLQVLDISKTFLTIESMIGLSGALGQPQLAQSLRHLDVSGNQIQDNSVMLRLAEATGLLTGLQYLDMSDNYLGDKAVCTLAKSLKGKPCIQTLRLRCVQMGPVALSSLKYNLGDCTALSVLDFEGNYFDSNVLNFADVLRPLSGATKQHGLPNLQQLNLSGVGRHFAVPVTSESVSSFISSITNHPNIETVELKYIEIKKSDLVRLLEACQQHRFLKELHISGDHANTGKSKTWSCLKIA